MQGQFYLKEADTTGEAKTDLEAEEERIEKLIKKDPNIGNTEKETIIKARKGQGKFREGVIALYKTCPFTGIEDFRFLRAGHLKPWSKCTNNAERMDPLNGIPLTPVADLLLDQGFISFDENGNAIFSSEIEVDKLYAMGIDPSKEVKIKIINEDHREYITYHRTKVFE